ncbi:MAG: hypothetical protein JXP72_04495, partial [Coriobacteriia bacterium]|nr:hypothetical protein [Coriobacteriia bacterium]
MTGSGQTVSEQRATLESLGRSLRQESHILAAYPGIVWQQLHNRLQWDDGPAAGLVTRGRERRSGPDAAPWAWVRTRFGESKALARTLTGHTDAVHGCAISPDGARIASAGYDWKLRVWDAATGAEVYVVEAHRG